MSESTRQIEVHLTVLRAMRAEGSMMGVPTELEALDAAIAALSAGEEVGAGGGEVVDATAWMEALELPEGYRVREHLPGQWDYEYEAEDGTEMVGSTNWNHPALAAIDAWQGFIADNYAAPHPAPAAQFDAEVAEALEFLLTRIGSWTSARWDQHLRHEFGDGRAEPMIRALAAAAKGVR